MGASSQTAIKQTRARGMRVFMTLAVCFLGLVSHTTATKCASGESISASGCECAAGFRVSAGLNCNDGNCTNSSARCVVCPAGTYSAAGDAACKPCVAGSYSNAGAALCTVTIRYVPPDTTAVDVAVETIFARFDALIAANDVDAAVSRAIESLDIENYMFSHAPLLYACAVIGLVGALLNSLATFVVVLWVRSLKGVETQTDAGVV